MGFLDNMTDEQQQGLMAAAAQMLQASGPSTRPVGIGQILGGGMGAYQDSSLAARKRKLDEQQAAQMAELRGLQIKDATGSLQDHDTARTEADRFRKYSMGELPQPGAQAMPMPAPQSAAATFGNAMSGQPAASAMPSTAAPPASGPAFGSYEYMMAKAQDLMKNGFPAQAQAMMKEAITSRPKYSTDFRSGMGADGKLHNYVLSDDGAPPRDVGIGVRPEMTEVDLGGSKQFVDKNRVTDGQSFKRTMTPGESAQTAQSAARLAFDKKQAEGGDDAAMDPLAIRMTAQQYLAGDSGALQNFGRGAQGSKNLNAVRLEVAKLATSAGMSGADIAAKMAEFGGIKAGQRTAGTRSASIEIAASEAAELAPLAVEASRKVARSGFLPFGKSQVMFDQNTNDPNLRQFAMANTALSNAYSQVMSRGGVATVSDKEHARELLSTAHDQPSYEAAVAQMTREIQAAQKAPGAVKKAISAGLTGNGGHEAAPAPAGKAVTLSDIAATAKASGRTTAEVTAALRAKGYTIGGQ